MNRVALSRIPLRVSRSPRLTRALRRGLLGLFLAQFGLVWANLCWPIPWFGSARWPEGLLLVLCAGTTLAALTQHLPGQNVMLASVLIALIAGAVQVLGALTAIPFGPYVYTEQVGPQLFHPLPWAVPCLWVVVVLNSRGVGRLILRPWRKTRAYGFWLLGTTTALIVLFDFGLEPFAAVVKRYWLWQPTKLSSNWYGMPWVNLVGWAVTALLILAFTTPSLINKKPVKRPPDYHPLIIWLLVEFLFATGGAVHHLWPAAVSALVVGVAVGIFAVRGAAW